MKKIFLINISKIPEFIFAIIAFIFGLLYIFLTPPYEVPDEISHAYRTCEVADGVFYNKYPAKVTKYDKYIIKLPPREEKEFHLASRYAAVMYIAPSLGVKISSAVTQNKAIIFYTGKIFSLLMYILLIFFAIKITPVFKYHFMFVALLPMSLFLAMGYSADSFNNAFSFLFFAYIFKLIYEKQEVSKKNFYILCFLSVISAFCKGIIYPIFLFPFLPKFSDEFKFKNKYFYIIPLILATLLVTFVWVSINYKNLNPSVPVVINDPLYLFKEPLKVINLMINTTIVDFYQYIQQAIGKLGSYYAIFFGKNTYLSCILAFLSLFIIYYEKISFKIKFMSFLIFAAFYCFIQYLQLIYWNGYDIETINGFQGRYFLSLLPLVFLFFPSFKFNISEQFKNIYFILTVVFLTYILYGSCTLLYEYYYEILVMKHLLFI